MTTNRFPKASDPWARLVEVFGSHELGHLTGATDEAITSYVRGHAEPPPSVINRATYLALVTDRLSCRFSDPAIRGWFSQSRMQLCGMTPAEVLASDWFPDSPGAQRVREIAYAVAANGQAL